MNIAATDNFIEQLFNTVQTGLLLGKAVYDHTGRFADFRIVRCNDIACQLTGYSQEELFAEPVLTINPDTQQNGFFDSWADVLQRGIARRYEHWLQRQQVWLDVSISKWEDYIICSISDITDRKKAAQKQQQQAVTLQNILDNIPVDLWISEAVRDSSGQIIDFKIIEANQQAIRRMGIEDRQVIGSLASQLFPEGLSNGVYERYIDVVEQQQGQQFLLAYNHNQQTIYLSIGLVPHGNDQVISTTLDITSLKLAEKDKERQADLLDRIFDSSLIALALHEPIRNQQGKIIDFCITKMNPMAAKWIKVPADQFCRISTLLPDFYSSIFYQTYVRVLSSGEPERFEASLGKHTYELLASKLGEELLVSANNITRLRQHQRQLEEVNLDLMRSNENLQQFAYVASHDLQEPLRKIQAFGDLLKIQFSTHLNEQGLDMVNRMQTSAARMAALITDLLTYSRISTQRDSFRSISLNHLLHDLIDDLEFTINEYQAQIDVGELPTIQGDQSQLWQLFQNLILNALKFRKATVLPHVRIVCRPAVVSELPKTLNPALPYYLISVSDNGIGFDEKYIDRIFQVFQRLHGRSKYSGTGVGLAICKKVVENHKGAITAHSQPEQGATFDVFLPMRSKD